MLGLVRASAFLLPLLAFRGDYLDYLRLKHSSRYERVSVAGCKDIIMLATGTVLDKNLWWWENKLLLTRQTFLGHLDTPYWVSRPPKLAACLHLSWWDHVNTFSLMSICTLLGIKCDLEPRKTRMLFSSLPLLKECALRVAGCWWGASPPPTACDVTCAVWSPWERTLMHTGNNQGNTGRAQKNANIFIVLKRKVHTRTHTHEHMSQVPPHHQANPSLTPI